MLRCCECGTKIKIDNKENGEIINCPECDIDLRFFNDFLFPLQLGPSEE